VRRSRSPKKRRSRSPKSLKKAADKEPIITITCGDVAENHVGNQQIGHLVSKGQQPRKNLKTRDTKLNFTTLIPDSLVF